MDFGTGEGSSTSVLEVGVVGSVTSVASRTGIVTCGGEEESILSMTLGILEAVSGIPFVKLDGAVVVASDLRSVAIITVAAGG